MRLETEITGLAAVALQVGATAGKHPTTAALLLGGEHQPSLTIRVDTLLGLDTPAGRTELAHPAQVCAAPGDTALLMVPLAGCEVAFDPDEPHDDRAFELGPWTPGNRLASRAAASPVPHDDLGYALDLQWLHEARLDGDPLTRPLDDMVAARLRLDRGRLAAAPPLTRAGLASVWELHSARGTHTQPLTDRLVLSYESPRPVVRVVVRSPGEGGTPESYTFMLGPAPGAPADQPVRLGVSSLCPWKRFPPPSSERMADVVEFGRLLQGAPQLTPPLWADLQVSVGEPSCPPVIVRY